jgi:hypothetical protein
MVIAGKYVRIILSPNLVTFSCIGIFKTDIRKNALFSKTIVDWNHLEDSVVCAKTVEGFSSALQQLD